MSRQRNKRGQYRKQAGWKFYVMALGFVGLVAVSLYAVLFTSEPTHAGTLDYGRAIQSGGLVQDFPPTVLPASGI